MVFPPRHHLDDLFDLDFFDASSAKDDPRLMSASAPCFDFTDLSGDCSPLLFHFDSPQIRPSALPTNDGTITDPAWQFWPDGTYTQLPSVQQQYSHNPPTQYYPSHRRALSTSSEISYPPDSPYSQASSLQYPSTYNHRPQYLAPSWDEYSSPLARAQHLPTPVHTPTSDAFMETKRARRTRQSHTPDSALAAHRSMRSALTHQSSSGNINNGSGNFPVPRGTFGSQSVTPTFPQVGCRDNPPNAQTGNTGETGLNLHHMWQSGDSLFDDPVVNRHVPKFDRTMSDIYQDELYNPPAATSIPTSAPNPTSMPAPQQPMSSQQPSRPFLATPQNLVSDRLNAAYLERSSSPGHQSRGPSPYAQASSFAATQENDNTQEQPRTAAAVREQNKARADMMAYAQHLSRDDAQQQQQQTVSPKDTCPADLIPEEENMPSLFPASSNQSGTSETAATYGPHNAEQPYDFNSTLGYGNMGFATPSVPASQMSNGTPGHRRRGQADSEGADADFPTSPPAHLPSMDTTNSDEEEVSDDDESPGRPSDPTARVGTYTCTYHGCTERFRTPSELQKHKREDHRSTGATGFGPAASSTSSPSAAATSMTQAGPHKCTRINPSTNKPCNTVFSRPYDLTRHEDTIHAERKKVRCPHCDEEKTFSRADALTRHLRVVHPHVSFPGKHRRRHE